MSGSLKEIHQQVCDAASELCEKSEIPAGTLFVVGCSSSEISGHAIGAQPAPIVGKTVVDALLEVLQPRGIHLVAQCCEHLNRALVVEREVMVGRWWAEEVNARPIPTAGGSFATAAYETFTHPMLVESMRAGRWPRYWFNANRYAFTCCRCPRSLGTQPGWGGVCYCGSDSPEVCGWCAGTV